MVKYYCTECKNFIKVNFKNIVKITTAFFKIDFDKSTFIEFVENGKYAKFYAKADDCCNMIILVKKKDFEEIKK